MAAHGDSTPLIDARQKHTLLEPATQRLPAEWQALGARDRLENVIAGPTLAINRFLIDTVMEPLPARYAHAPNPRFRVIDA